MRERGAEPGPCGAVPWPPFVHCRTLFEVVLFEECSNQWSLSRPMLPLILISEQIYNALKVRLGATTLPTRARLVRRPRTVHS